MPLALRGAEAPSGLFQLLSGGEVCEGDIKLRALHVHVHADEPVLFRQGHARFNGIIEEIAENAAEIELRHFELYGNVRVGLHRDAARFGEGYLAVQNGVRHGVAGFDDGVHGVQIGVQLVEIGADGVHIALGGECLEHLNVVAVVVPPAAELAVHVFYLFIMRVHQLALVGFELLIDAAGK